MSERPSRPPPLRETGVAQREAVVEGYARVQADVLHPQQPPKMPLRNRVFEI